MNGILLLISFLLIRFGFLSFLNTGAIKRAAHFPPMSGNGILAYWIYQISNIAIFVYLMFLTVIIEPSWRFYTGIVIYVSGLILCVICMINFAVPSDKGMNLNGLYRFSRNPMYVSYFVYFVGCTVLTKSLILGGIVLIFQTTAHWIYSFRRKVVY